MEFERLVGEIVAGGSQECLSGHLSVSRPWSGIITTVRHHQMVVTGDILNAAFKLPIPAQDEGENWQDRVA